MGGRSKQNNHEAEAAYVKRVLSGIDRKVELPESLRGSALRAKISDIPAPVTREEKRRGFWRGSSIFTRQSALSYAMTLAVMIGIVYLAQRSIPNLVAGNINIDQQTGEHAAVQDNLPDDYAVDPIIDAPVGGLPDNRGADDGAAAFAADGIMGQGGGGQTIPLGEHGGYVYAWRANDQRDPDKAGLPVTVDIADAGGVLAAQIDIPDMSEIYSYAVEGDVLMLAGSGSHGIVTRLYSGMQAMQPVEQDVMIQPGIWHAGMLAEDGTAYVVTLTGSAPEMPSFPLVDSAQQGVCVIGALGGGSNQLAVLGVGMDAEISLDGDKVEITYPGAGDDQALTARILLDGLLLAPEE